MNPFLLRPRERLTNWKAFRQGLSVLPEMGQLEHTACYWAQAPLFNKAFDLSDPGHWNSPWEMIAFNRWCRRSTAIGMEFTLRLAGWDMSRLCLKWIADFDHQTTFMVVEIDNRYWLNHEYRHVIPVGGSYKELVGWSHDGRRYVPLAPVSTAMAA